MLDTQAALEGILSLRQRGYVEARHREAVNRLLAKHGNPMQLRQLFVSKKHEVT